jgi:uncharacterized membrane protein YozB (DUF420 family)
MGTQVLDDIERVLVGSKLFPDSRPFMLSDLSLIIMTIAFVFLLYAVYIQRKSTVKHGKIARTAFFLALPAVFYMLYSKSRGFTLPYYNSLLGVHMLLGILTISFGILFVTNQWKWKVKKYMDLGALLWTGTFLLGITVYFVVFGLISP